jgi:hypothetical protein
LVRADQSDCPLLAPIHSLYTQSRVHPQPVHTTVLPPPQTRLYGVRPMGRTPIYDQLRGERINTDVPAAEAGPQVGGRRGRHHVLVVAPGPAAVAGPPGPSTGLEGTDTISWRRPRRFSPQVTGTRGRGGGTASSSFAGSPRAASTGTRRQQLPGASHNTAAQGTAAGDHGAHWGQGVDRDRHRTHTEPRTAAPADAQFSWF